MRPARLRLPAVAAACLLAACAHRSPPAASTPGAGHHGARVMILGLYHFANPNLDVVKTDIDDHRSPRRQAEIAEVARRLAAFRPTRILVEAADQDRLDAAYDAYRRGAAPLGPDETEQLGFRMARAAGLDRIGAIDHPMDMDFDRVMAAAAASGDRVFLDTFQATIAAAQKEAAAQHERTVVDNLRALNDPARIDRDRALYLLLARVAHGGDFAGADVLAIWHQRNFRIFASLVQAIGSPDDRVLVLYGQGHAALLRELVAASPDLVLVEPNDYLGR